MTTTTTMPVIKFGTFTSEEAEQLQKESTFHVHKTTVVFGSFTLQECQQLMMESTLYLDDKKSKYSQSQLPSDFKPIRIKLPDKDVTVCKRCYRTGHMTYDCYATTTISGVSIPDDGRIIIHLEPEPVNTVRRKSKTELREEAQLNAILSHMYQITNYYLYGHAHYYMANDMAIYGY